jgi:RHS repeat-associated protein
VKYVWNGETRVARVTGTLSGDATRTQRLRLAQGWNLVAVNVGGAEAQLDPASQPILEAAVKWDAGAHAWLPANTTPLAAHTPCWLFAREVATLSIKGSNPANKLIPIAPGPQFVVNPDFEALEIATAFPADTDLLLFDPTTKRWRARYTGGAAVLSDAPGTIPTHTSVFVRASKIGKVAVTDAALEIRYYHQDHLGNPNVITDSCSNLVEEQAYFPFGCTRHLYRTASITEVYGYAQKERDTESGLYYFEARFLDVGVDRFLSVDPLTTWIGPEPVVNSARLNPYAYASNNPINRIDPWGLADEEMTMSREALLEKYSYLREMEGYLKDKIQWEQADYEQGLTDAAGKLKRSNDELLSDLAITAATSALALVQAADGFVEGLLPDTFGLAFDQMAGHEGPDPIDFASIAASQGVSQFLDKGLGVNSGAAASFLAFAPLTSLQLANDLSSAHSAQTDIGVELNKLRGAVWNSKVELKDTQKSIRQVERQLREQDSMINTK